MPLLLTDQRCECTECFERLDPSDMNESPDGDLMCEHCYNHKYGTCCRCDEVTERDELYSNDGRLYCQDCESEVFISCERCGDTCYVDDAFEAGGQYFCGSECARRSGFCECEDCNETINTNREDYHSVGDNVICQSCYEENYFCCEGCDENYHNDDGQYDEHNECMYCNSCHRGARRQEEALIKDYSYKPREYNYSRMAWENTVYLGIELEVECKEGDNPVEKAKLVVEWLTKKGLQERVYIKDDGSLRNGFELVFHPSTLQAIHKKFPMKDFLQYLQDIHITSHQSGRCGLHVHISKKKLTERDLYKGKMFFYKCQHWLQKFSCRKADGMNYCKFADVEPSLLDCSQEGGRYSAFNVYASISTCELRLFRGTLIYDRFLASLQFSECFIEYIQKIGVAYTKTTPKIKMWHDFIDWAKATGKYKHFTDYILQKGLI